MGDEEVGQVQVVLQILHQVQDLGLNGHVQGGDRLVADDELGVQSQGPGDTDSLAASAVQLVGIGVDQSVGKAHHVHDLMDFLVNTRLVLVAVDLLHQQRGRDGLADRHTGVQRGKGVLENDLHIPAHVLHLRLVKGQHVLALEVHMAGCGLVQAEDGAAHGGFSAAGLAHHAQGLARGEGEADVVHRVEHAVGHGEVFLQVFNPQDFRSVLSHSSPPPHCSGSSGPCVRRSFPQAPAPLCGSAP